MAFIHWR